MSVLGVVLLLFSDALGRFAHSASRHTACYFLLVAHSARYWSAHHTWQTRFRNVLSVKHWHTEAFFLGRTSTYLLFSNFSWSEGDRTRNPWVGSQESLCSSPFSVDIGLPFNSHFTLRAGISVWRRTAASRSRPCTALTAPAWRHPSPAPSPWRTPVACRPPARWRSPSVSLYTLIAWKNICMSRKITSVP